MTAVSPITTHVLDTRLGQPARGIAVVVEKQDDAGGWQSVGRGVTNDDGRITDLLPPGSLATGVYRITFETGVYFTATGTDGFYPRVSITFEVTDGEQHYHVPLLLSPFGYTTYRGS